jgi:hypothetical protein
MRMLFFDATTILAVRLAESFDPPSPRPHDSGPVHVSPARLSRLRPRGGDGRERRLVKTGEACPRIARSHSHDHQILVPPAGP